MRHLTLALLFLSVVLAGCGSSDSIALDPGRSPEVETVTGTFFLGRHVSGGNATLETLEGEPLAQSAVGPTGEFLFAGVSLPAQFRVRVIPPDAKVSFFTDAERSDPSRHLWVNVPTTLVSLLRQATPGLSLAESESQIRSLLGLEPDFILRTGLSDSSRSPFSHLAFFVDASAAGGWSAFSSALLSEAGSTRAQGSPSRSRFVAERSDLSAPLDGLEEGLASHAVQLQGYQPLILSLAGAATKSILGFVGQSLGKSVLGEAIDGGVKAAWTAVAEHFGLNYGTQVALQEIENELGTLNQELSSIAIDISEETYTNAAESLSPSIAYLQQLSSVKTNGTVSSDGAFARAMNEAVATGLPSNQPTAAPDPKSEIGNLLTQIEGFETAVDLAEIAEFQLPGAAVGNMNLLWRENKVDTPLAVQPDARFMGMPFRSNQWLDVALTNYNFYAGYQEVGGKWLADNARQGDDPSSDIAGAVSPLNRLAISLKSQRGQFPLYLPSDLVAVDLQFGIMWYLNVQGPATAATAKANAEALSLSGDVLGTSVTYDDWRLPCYNELKALQDRARFCSADLPKTTSVVPLKDGLPYGDLGNSTVGLERLGFQAVAEAFNDAGNGGDAKDGGVWFESYTEYDGQWSQEGIAELELNHSQKINRKPSNDKRPFLVCRSIGRPVVNAQDPSQPNQDPTVVKSTYPLEMTPNPVNPMEFACLGVPTAVVVSSGGQSQVNATVTYTLYLGGDFRTGNETANASQSVYQYSTPTQLSISTEKAASSNAGRSNSSGGEPVDPGEGLSTSSKAQFNGLALVPWFESSNPLLQPSNYPPAYDPKDASLTFTEALNAFGSSGYFFKYADQLGNLAATITASVQGYDPGTDSFPVVLSGANDPHQTGAYDDGLTRQPHILQIAPRNRIYNRSGGILSDRYSSSLFYKNLTVSSKSDEVEWRLLDASGALYTGNAARLSGRFSADPGLLQVDPSQIPSGQIQTFQIRAELTIGTGTSAASYADTVSFQVVGTQPGP